MSQNTKYLNEILDAEDNKLIIFCKDKLFIKDNSYYFEIKEVLDLLENNIISIFKNNNIIFVNINLNENIISSRNITLKNVKNFLRECSNISCNIIIKAYQWLTWDNRSKFCGSCGSELQSNITTTEKSCSNCKISFFPRFSPAIMVLIKKENQILLGRSNHFPEGVYSALAGFVDLGESAEDAVIREVREEVGIDIENIKYFGTQTWPFPDSFMIAFTADYKSGEINIDHEELEDAKWFYIDKLPKLPAPLSISRQLIDFAIK